MNDTLIDNLIVVDTNHSWALALAIELAYFILFVLISWWIHKRGFLKVDQDRITIHHRIHKEMIMNQEKAFIQQQEEILSPMKSPLTPSQPVV